MQFLDHDLVATVDDEEGPKFNIDMSNGQQSAVMTLARLVVEQSGNSQCRIPLTVNTPVIDAGPVYGSNEQFLKVHNFLLHASSWSKLAFCLSAACLARLHASTGGIT